MDRVKRTVTAASIVALVLVLGIAAALVRGTPPTTPDADAYQRLDKFVLTNTPLDIGWFGDALNVDQPVLALELLAVTLGAALLLVRANRKT